MSAPHPITRALLAAIQHSPEPMVLTDPALPDHPMIAVNTAFAALTGYPIAETVGRNCRFLQGPGTDPAVPPRIRASIAAQRGCIEWIVNHRRDGAQFWNLLFILPVFAPDGTLLHYFGNQRDITREVPADLPDYTIGQAAMPPAGQAAFDALLRGIAAESATAGDAAARELERITGAAHRLNELTINLAPDPR